MNGLPCVQPVAADSGLSGSRFVEEAATSYFFYYTEDIPTPKVTNGVQDRHLMATF